MKNYSIAIIYLSMDLKIKLIHTTVEAESKELAFVLCKPNSNLYTSILKYSIFEIND